MPFNLVNILAAFQSYINKILHKYLDIFMIIYLNNIVIYFSCEKDYKKYVYKVLKTLVKAGLYIKLSKYQFSLYKIDFLGYYIFIEKISIESL